MTDSFSVDVSLDEAGSVLEGLDAPAALPEDAPIDNATFLAQQSRPEMGLNEWAADEESVEQTAVEPVRDASPLAGPETNPAASQSSPAAPQLDSNQQFMLMMAQQFQAQQAESRAFQQQLMERLAPREAPKPVDPFAAFDPELRKELEANPQLKKFTETLMSQFKAPVDEYRQQMEQRIQEAYQQREAQRFGSEADAIARDILQGVQLDGQGQARVRDLVRDLSLSLTSVHGGSPAQYAQAIKNTFEEYARGRGASLGAQAKQKVAAQQSLAPRAAANQNARPGMVPGGPQTEPGDREIFAAGYQSRTEAIMDGYGKVRQLRARQGQGY